MIAQHAAFREAIAEARRRGSSEASDGGLAWEGDSASYLAELERMQTLIGELRACARVLSKRCTLDPEVAVWVEAVLEAPIQPRRLYKESPEHLYSLDHGVVLINAHKECVLALVEASNVHHESPLARQCREILSKPTFRRG